MREARPFMALMIASFTLPGCMKIGAAGKRMVLMPWALEPGASLLAVLLVARVFVLSSIAIDAEFVNRVGKI
jgi:hypothetical protein